MKKLTSIFAISLLALIISSCKKETGKVVFQNRSVYNHSYDVVWDGSVIASLYPQMDSDTFEVAPGPHTCVFKISNSGAEACNQGNPVVQAGFIYTLGCSH